MFKFLAMAAIAYVILNQEKQMAQIDDLNSAIETLSTDLADVGTNVSTVLGELKTAQARGTAPDLSSAIAKLQGVDEKIKAIDETLKAAETQKTATPAVAEASTDDSVIVASEVTPPTA